MHPGFPPHLPGQTPRPPDGAFDSLKAGLSPGMAVAELQHHAGLRGGVRLLAMGYCWEAHEVLEAVWLSTVPGSREQHFVRALIQLANARLKWRMGQERAAARIAALSLSHLREAGLGGQREVLGFDLENTRTGILHYNAENSDFLRDTL